MPAYIDLSHTLEDGMKAYPGLPDARIGAIATHEDSRARYEGKAEFYLGKVDFRAISGRTSIRRFTAIRTAPIWPRYRSRKSPAFPAWCSKRR